MRDTPAYTRAGQVAGVRAQHHARARQHAAQVERCAKQLVLEVGRGNPATDLSRQLAECLHMLQGELNALRVLDEVAAMMRRAAA